MIGFWSTLIPPPRRTASEWADAERVLSSKTSSKPGQWTTMPHQREPLDRASISDLCQWIILCWGSQMGKSDVINCMTGYWSQDAPAPILMLQPTLDLAKRYSKMRIDPMIEDCPALRARWADKTSRDSGNTTLLKDFDGGVFVMAGANTASGVSSMPIRYLGFDEADQYPPSASGDGDPIEIAIKRTASFPRRKIVLTSTPTYEHRPVWQWMRKTGWREFYVPCPHCGEFQVLVWENLRWDDGDPDSVQYHCKHCGVGIEESHKRTMFPAGEWRARNSERETGRMYGYHLPSLYAPHGWTAAGWPELVREYEEAKGDNEKMRVFYNTRLALPFDDADVADVDPDGLAARGEVYDRPVPDGVRVLTAGVDVQQDRVEVEIVGWGDGEESWSIDYAALPGDPTGPQVWRDLDAYLARPRDGLTVSACCVDSGYLAEQVQRWCHDRRGRRIWAIKGVSGPQRPVWPKRGSRGRKGTGWRVWLVGVDNAKDVLWRRWPIGSPGPGYCHIPADRDGEWHKQVLGERPQVSRAGRREWVAQRGVRSEALDCRVYAYAALCSLMSAGRRLEDVRPPERGAPVVEPTPEPQPRERPSAPVRPARPAARKRPRSSWLDPGGRAW